MSIPLAQVHLSDCKFSACRSSARRPSRHMFQPRPLKHTSGSADGWATAGVLTPLIISIYLTAGFFYEETLIPFDKAVMQVPLSLSRVREYILPRPRPPRAWLQFRRPLWFSAAAILLWNVLFVAFTTLWWAKFQCVACKGKCLVKVRQRSELHETGEEASRDVTQ